VGQARISTNCNIALHWTPPLLLTKQAIGRERTGPASLLVMPNFGGRGVQVDAFTAERNCSHQITLRHKPKVLAPGRQGD
jgi:hypothetical protein